MVASKVERGDVLTMVGTPKHIADAAAVLGYVDRPTTETDMVYVGVFIFLGGLMGIPERQSGIGPKRTHVSTRISPDRKSDALHLAALNGIASFAKIKSRSTEGENLRAASQTISRPVVGGLRNLDLG